MPTTRIGTLNRYQLACTMCAKYRLAWSVIPLREMYRHAFNTICRFSGETWTAVSCYYSEHITKSQHDLATVSGSIAMRCTTLRPR